MFASLIRGVAMCTPLLLLVWGVCWWRGTRRWLLGVSLIAASLVSYLVCSRWLLSWAGETGENVSEARDVLVVYVGACQLVAFGMVLVPALRMQNRRRERLSR